MHSIFLFMMAKRDMRRAAIAGVLLLVLIGTVIYWAGTLKRQSLLDELEGRMSARVNANAEVLTRQIEYLRRDVQFLSSVPPVGGIARASENAGFDATENTPVTFWQRRLESIFREYLAANPDVFQVRLIGIAQHGRELERVERIGDRIVVAPPGQLQATGDADFVRQTSSLAARQVYVSDMLLHRVQGQVQVPHRALLQVATPVFTGSGKLFGIVAIDYEAIAILRPLQANLYANFQAYLNNERGDFLLHPVPSRTFGFELGRPWRWQDEFQAVDDARSADLPGLQRYASGETMVYASGKVIPLGATPADRALTFRLVQPASVIDQIVDELRMSMLGAMLIGALVVFGIGWLYTRQQRQLMAYQASLSAIVESSDDAIIGKTLDGIVTSWNQGAERMFGFSAEEAIGMPLRSLIIPPGAEAEAASILQRVGNGEALSGLHTLRCRSDGRVLNVSVTASPIKSSDGRVIGIAKTVRDISEQVSIDLRIRELNSSLEQQVRDRTRQIQAFSILQRAILTNASYAIIATDMDGVITLFNPAAERMLGYAAHDMLKKKTLTLFHDEAEIEARVALLAEELDVEVAPGFEVLVARARRGLANEYTWTYIRKDGSRFPVLLSVSALRADDGSINGFLGIASDITLREQDKQRLLAARDQLLNAADVAELGIWNWVVEDDSLEWNERMLTFYGLTAEDAARGLHYEDWHSRLHPDDADATVAQIQAAVAGTGRFDATFRVVHADGAIRHLQAAASVERDLNGKAVRVIGINRDITAQREAEAALRAAKAAAESANTAKSEFLANMSHEIRSPMNAVLGMLMLLKQTELAPRQLDYASKAEVAGRTLLGILNDILDFSRVEAGKLTLDLHPFSVDKILRDVAVILSANVGDKDLDILYEIDPALPDWLVGDALRLQQVLLNLAGNAIKFTASGEVVIAVSLADGEEEEGTGPLAPDNLWLAVAIRDTGIGISAEQCQRIFDGFSQAEASTARRYGGSGLGLAISQRLVRLMGGSLTVESTPGVGSTFRFRVACQRGAAPTDLAYRAVPDLRHLKCMVIDDHEIARHMMCSMASKFGWQAVAADSGAQALERLAANEGDAFDVIFVDWRMPGMDGWETSERIRQCLPDAERPLIVMVSAHGREVLGQRHGPLQSMLDGFLVKPVTSSMLFDAVADALATRTGPADATPALMLSRLAGVRLLVVEDNLTNQQVACELLRHDGAIVTLADGGRAAIDAVRAADPPFDCVLMDIQMPDMDGYAATRIIRADPAQRALPIIAMTANAMDSDRVAALEAGMNDHVGKPFDLAQLIGKILAHVERARLSAEAAPPLAGGPAQVNPATESSAPDLAPAMIPAGATMDGKSALARFGGNLPVYRRALESFLRDAARMLDTLPAVAPEQDDGALRHTLHTLKGLAATVGAIQLAQQAETMESALRGAGWQDAWREQLACLRATGEETAQAAAALIHSLEQEAAGAHGDAASQAASAPAVVPAQDSLASSLARLHALLKASNMEALDLFDALSAAHGGNLPPLFEELGQAVEQFDFVRAAGLAHTMLQGMAPPAL